MPERSTVFFPVGSENAKADQRKNLYNEKENQQQQQNN